MEDKGNFFRLNVKLLKFGGIWVVTGTNKFHKIYNAIWISYSMVYFTIAQLLSLKSSYQSRSDLIRNLNMASSFIVSFYKVGSWFFWRKEILRTMDILEETTRIFDEHDDFEPKSIVKKNMIFKDHLIKIFHTLSLAVSSLCFLTRLFEVSFHGKEYEVISNLTGYEYVQELPYQSWIPFNHKKSKFHYMLAVLMQCLALFNCGSIAVALDMLFTSLMIFTTVHFNLLQGAFKTLTQKCARRLQIDKEYLVDPPKLVEVVEMEQRKYIIHLQRILEICELLEKIYCYLILTQLLVSLIVLCTCLFLISTVSIGSIGNDLAYLLAMENQLALYCYAADELTQSASKIPQALFEGNWLSTSKNFKDYMRFTMMRMGKPVHLTIGKFSPLTLSTFVTIGRASYSLLAIIKR